MLTAYVDEAFEVGRPGLYVLGAVLADPGDEQCRQEIRELLLPRQPQLHFTKESPKRRLQLAETVGGLSLPSLVTVRASADAAERARGLCLVRLAWALSGLANSLVFEAREGKLNEHDKTVLAGLASHGPRLSASFVPAGDDPLLWAADVLSGAIFQDLARAQPAYRAALGPVTLLES